MQAEDSAPGKAPLTLPRKASKPGNGAQKGAGLPRPQVAKERGGVKFAPQLEIVSEAPAREGFAALSQEMSPATSSIQQKNKDTRAELKSAIWCVLFREGCLLSMHAQHNMQGRSSFLDDMHACLLVFCWGICNTQWRELASSE